MSLGKGVVRERRGWREVWREETTVCQGGLPREPVRETSLFRDSSLSHFPLPPMAPTLFLRPGGDVSLLP